MWMKTETFTWGQSEKYFLVDLKNLNNIAK